MNSDVAYGIEADPHDPWVAAASALTPDKSLGRIAANARFTVGTVTVVGTALTALGLVTAASVAEDAGSRVFALSAVVSATLAVVLALSYLVVRLERLNISDLEQVRLWYLQQFRRSWLPALAGWLLVVAVVLGAIGGVSAVLRPAKSPEPQLSLSATGAGRNYSVIARAAVSDLEPGTVFVVDVIGTSDRGIRRTLFENHTRVGEDGKASVEATVENVPVLQTYSISLRALGRSVSLTLP